MSKICILGTREAGKTVFISVLAYLFKDKDAPYYLEPKNKSTDKNIGKLWDKLFPKEGIPEWPASTPAGAPDELTWTLRTSSGGKHDLTVLDTPGQDIQAIFDDPDGKALRHKPSPAQRALKSRIEEASCVVFLINLGKIIKEKSEVTKVEYRAPIVGAIKKLIAQDIPVALLFSQYETWKHEEPSLADGPMENWLGKYFPSLHSVLQEHEDKIKQGKIKLLPVSAVKETENVPVSVEEETEEGLVTRTEIQKRPAKDFKSAGVKEAMDWICEKLSEIDTARYNRQISEKRRRVLRRMISYALFFAGLCALALYVGSAWINWNEGNARETRQESLSAAESLRKTTKEIAEKQFEEAQDNAKKKYSESREKVRMEELESKENAKRTHIASKSEAWKNFHAKEVQVYELKKSELNAIEQTLSQAKADLLAKQELAAKERNLTFYEETPPPEEWKLKINSTVFGKDHVELTNLGKEPWISYTLAITPKNDETIFRDGNNIPPNHPIIFEKIYNFKGDGDTAIATLKILTETIQKKQKQPHEDKAQAIEKEARSIFENAQHTYDSEKLEIETRAKTNLSVLKKEYEEQLATLDDLLNEKLAKSEKTLKEKLAALEEYKDNAPRVAQKQKQDSMAKADSDYQEQCEEAEQIYQSVLSKRPHYEQIKINIAYALGALSLLSLLIMAIRLLRLKKIR